jgi:hypothetical protein
MYSKVSLACDPQASLAQARRDATSTPYEEPAAAAAEGNAQQGRRQGQGREGDGCSVRV